MGPRWWAVLFVFSLLEATTAAAAETPCEPVAKVADKRICLRDLETVTSAPPAAQAHALLEAGWVPLFEEYAKSKKLQPTEAEIGRQSALFDKMRPPGMEPHQVEVGFIRNLVLSWKVGGHLHRRYGGRVSLSSFGFHLPIDAIAAWLRDQESRGSFAIYDEKVGAAFWRMIETAAWGDGVVDEAEGRSIYAAPPWEVRSEPQASSQPARSPDGSREEKAKRLAERVRAILAAEGRDVDLARLTILPGRVGEILVGRVIFEDEDEILVDIDFCRSSNVFYNFRRPYFKERVGSQKCGDEDYQTFAVRQE